MAKFNIGDKVRILNGSNINNYRGSWVDGMNDYVGQVRYIDSISTPWGGTVGYSLDEIPFTWDERGLELVESISIISDKVLPDIVNVIYNKPATIVFWADGTKTVVKCQPGDKWSKEVGLAMAIVKKTYGNTGNYNNIFNQWR